MRPIPAGILRHFLRGPRIIQGKGEEGKRREAGGGMKDKLLFIPRSSFCLHPFFASIPVLIPPRRAGDQV